MVSRREFLRTSSAAAAATLFSNRCLPAEKTAGRKAISFTVISDTHIGYKDQKSAEHRWEQTAAEVARQPGEFVLHLGDVVDGGRVEQYPIYRKIREQITRPVYEIPGNHDPLDAFAKAIRPEIDMVVQQDWLRCLLLGNARRTSHDGFFEESQLDWLERSCRTLAKEDCLGLIACHVPVHTNRHPDTGWYVKPEHGQTRFYEIIRRYQDRLLGVIHGHFHCGIRGWSDHDIHEICLPSVLYNRDRNIKPPAKGYNLQEFRPGYTLMTIGEGDWKLRYKPRGEEVRAERELPC